MRWVLETISAPFNRNSRLCRMMVKSDDGRELRSFRFKDEDNRWLWPGISPSSSRASVVVVGDAWHLMTPNLGHGGCCALEDSLVLAQKLATAVNNPHAMSIEEALKSYERERWARIFPLTVRANVVGAVLQLENPVVCAVGDNLLLKLVRLSSMLEHTKHRARVPSELDLEAKLNSFSLACCLGVGCSL